VIKSGIPVVCSPLPQSAEEVVRQVAADAGARVVRALDVVSIAAREDGRADFTSDRYALAGVDLALRGRHQIENAAVAIALLGELDHLGIAVDANAARSGLETVSWPGRLEHVTVAGAEIVLDAAHNPAGAAALREYLQSIGWTDAVLVFGVMADKDAVAMLRALAPVCRRIVCTTAVSPRAMPAGDLAATAAAVGRWEVESEPSAAAALERARRAGPRVVVAGSIFLIGPLRDILR
jgi:dihydrofolate synthase/folylpolyglutamate synthase